MLADYLSTDSWVLTYAFVRSTEKKATSTIVGQADGSHLVTIVAADSVWTPGVWRWQAYVTKAGVRHTVASGELTVLPNFAAATTGYDARSHAEKVLDAVQATIEGRASSHHLSYSVDTGNGSRSVGSMSHAQLLVLRDRYKIEVDREKKAAGLATGMGTSRLVVRIRGCL